MNRKQTCLRGEIDRLVWAMLYADRILTARFRTQSRSPLGRNTMEIQFRELKWTELAGRWHMLCTLCWEMWGRLWSVSRVGCRGLKPYLCQFFFFNLKERLTLRGEMTGRIGTILTAATELWSAALQQVLWRSSITINKAEKPVTPDVFKQSFAILADRANEKPRIVDDPVVSLCSLADIPSAVHIIALNNGYNSYIRNVFHGKR